MGSSRSRRKPESLVDDGKFFHEDTATDGVDSVSLMCDPGRNATVLAHNDLAVDGPGVHWVSRGAGHSLRSSTCMKIMGLSGPFVSPQCGRSPVVPLAGVLPKGMPISSGLPVGNIATPTIQLEIYDSRP